MESWQKELLNNLVDKNINQILFDPENPKPAVTIQIQQYFIYV